MGDRGDGDPLRDLRSRPGRRVERDERLRRARAITRGRRLAAGVLQCVAVRNLSFGSGVLLGLLSSWLCACASGRTEADAGRRFPDAMGADAFESACEPACTEGFVCIDGSCQPPRVDTDGDGIDVALDCDDFDFDVGRTLERTCAGECGSGVERCTDGVWSACDAPVSCDCEAGAAPRVVSCAMCGQQRQICVGGRWVDDGACTAGSCTPGARETGAACGNCGVQSRECQADCTWGAWMCAGEGECAAGSVEPETQRCGLCGTGTQSRMRSCGMDCRWGSVTPWGACGGDSVECMPGASETDTQSCGNCGTGTQSRTRTCIATSCTWGPWSAFGECAGGGACAPGETRACSNGDSCGVERCSASCGWGGCEPRDAGGCLRIRPGTSGPAGNNYRCCSLTASDQGWQFCLPSCAWSTACDPTTAC